MRIMMPVPPPLLPPSKTCARSPDKTKELPGYRSTPLNIPVPLFKGVKAIKTRVVLGTGCETWTDLSIFRQIKGVNASIQLASMSLTSFPHTSATVFLFSDICRSCKCFEIFTFHEETYLQPKCYKDTTCRGRREEYDCLGESFFEEIRLLSFDLRYQFFARLLHKIIK